MSQLHLINLSSPSSAFSYFRAALIELFVDGSSVNRHFHNLAHWFGRAYEGVPIGNPINVDQMTTAILRAINNIDLSKF